MFARLKHACVSTEVGARGAMLPVAVEAQDSVEQFYKGKQYRVVITGAVSTDYDMYARLITRLMTKYLPGNPSFVPQKIEALSSGKQ